MAHTVTELIDDRPLSGFQIMTISLCGVVLLLDGFDTQSIGFLAPAIAKELGLAMKAFGPVFSAALIGLMIGAMASGPIADRVGRKIVVIGSALTFAVFTILTARAATLQEFVIFRFLTGLGLGGAMPNVVALTSEYTPKRLQPIFVSGLFAGMPLGALVASVLSSRMLPLWGWRSVFYVGGTLPFVIALLLIKLLPESVRFLAATGADPRQVARIMKRISPELERVEIWVPPPGPESRGIPVKYLFTEGRAAGTVLLWIPFFMNLLLLYFFVNWLPGLLTTAGLPISAGVTAAGIFSLGGMTGSLIQGKLMKAFGAFAAIFVEFSLSVLLMVAMAYASSFALMMTATLILGITIQGGQAGLNALSASYYPTAVRSTGVGWALGIGRVGSIVGPMLAGILLSLDWTPAQIFLAGTIPALIAALAVLTSRMLGGETNAYRVPVDFRQVTASHS
jgi:AAHS family 4-hydroxybenzoate transporter-like MFS transporter